MRSAVFAGSFDPFTVGHLDILLRGAKLFDKIYVCVLVNSAKRVSFTAQERCDMIREAAEAAGLTNVAAEHYDGLTVEYAKSRGACAILRGLRDGDDFSYENRLAAINRHLAPQIDTVFLAAEPTLMHISSSMVKTVASYHGSIDGLVPAVLYQKIAERLIER